MPGGQGWAFLERNRDFLKLWSGQTISLFGSRITGVALPLTAVVLLHASPLEMSVLSASATIPHLLFSLLAGVWVDRLPRRWIMVVADVARALLLGSIPLAAALGLLHIRQLFAVAFLGGFMTMLFDVASLSLLPALVGRDELARANGMNVLSMSVASTAGPSVAGVITQLLTAPAAIALDAVSYVASAACTLLVRTGSQAAGSARSRVRMGAEILEGLRATFGSPTLASITVAATIGATGGAMQVPLVVLFLVRSLHLAPGLVGAAFALAGAASVTGALLSARSSRQAGPGPTFISGMALTSLTGVFLVSAQAAPALRVPCLVMAMVVMGLGPPFFAIPQRTLRQALVPDEVLGRVNATWRALVFGAQPLGAFLGGVLATALGLRSALVAGSALIALGAAWALLSPLRVLREEPA